MLDTHKLFSVGTDLGIPMGEAAAALRSTYSPGESLEESLQSIMAGIQLGSVATRGVNMGRLSLQEAEGCLQKCHELFEGASREALQGWLVRMRSFDSDFCVERDFIVYGRKSGDFSPAEAFSILLTSKFGETPPAELAEVQKTLALR